MLKLLIACCCCLVVGFGLFLVASPQESAALAQEGEMAEATLAGCLSAGEMEGYFVLTDAETEEATQVEAAEEVSICDHVGHTVKLTGSWAEEEEGEEGRHFHATKVEHVATSCEVPESA